MLYVLDNSTDCNGKHFATSIDMSVKGDQNILDKMKTKLYVCKEHCMKNMSCASLDYNTSSEDCTWFTEDSTDLVPNPDMLHIVKMNQKWCAQSKCITTLHLDSYLLVLRVNNTCYGT